MTCTTRVENEFIVSSVKNDEIIFDSKNASHTTSSMIQQNDHILHDRFQQESSSDVERLCFAFNSAHFFTTSLKR